MAEKRGKPARQAEHHRRKLERLAQTLARRKGLDSAPAALAPLHKIAQAVLRRLAAKGVARAVASVAVSARSPKGRYRIPR